MQKTQTKPNPKLAPIVSLQPHTPRSITTRPTPKPFPGTGTGTGQGARTGPQLTEAEIADRGKRIALLNREIGKHDAAKAELRNEMFRLIFEIASGADLDSIEVCSECKLLHEGICNA